MPRVCGVCRHPTRDEIDAALLEGRESFRNLAKRIGTSPAAVFRHRAAHLPAKLVKAEEAREAASADTLAAKLVAIEGEARRLGQKAEEAGDTRTALMAVRELVRLIELAARISGELQGAKVQVNLSLRNWVVEAPAEETREEWLARHTTAQHAIEQEDEQEG